MSKVEWGKKVVCSNCETKFYDLNRKPAVCPNCGTEYIEPALDSTPTNAKQVFTDEVDTVTDTNLVGSDASESIAEVEELVPVGALDKMSIHTPGVYVQRIFEGKHEKRIEQRTTRAA